MHPVSNLEAEYHFDTYFRFDYNQMFGGKILKDVDYSEQLDLRPFMTTKVCRQSNKGWVQITFFRFICSGTSGVVSTVMLTNLVPTSVAQHIV